MTPSTRRDLITAEFVARYDASPLLWARAPGRVDLMGSHTDYNEGFVMTMAIDLDTWLVCRSRPDRQVRIASLNMTGESGFSLDNIPHSENVPWSNYVRGVAWALQQEGLPLTGFDGLFHSTIPFGSGLSSSAAIEVVSAVAFQLLADWQLNPVNMALICQKAENQFVGVNSGILDQYSSVMGQTGQVLTLDCRHLTSTTASLPEGIGIVICDTRSPRELTGTEYDERRAQCEEGVSFLQPFYPAARFLRDISLEQFEAHEADLPPIVAKRCRFIIEENLRVLALGEALSAGDLAQLDTLTENSYVGARDLYEIGAPAMAAMIEAMRSAPGIIGARQAGAGFGGCMVGFVRSDRVPEFARHVHRAYRATAGLEPKIFPVQAAPGAGELRWLA